MLFIRDKIKDDEKIIYRSKKTKRVIIQIYGVIESYRINYDKNKISGYDIFILEEKTGNRYKVPVDEKIYNMFIKGDKILLKAKKGSLGIVYDECFYKN